MIVASIAVGYWLARQIVNITPGYYTYRSLAASLQSQGYEADVTRAPDRVIAVSLNNVSLETLARGLQASTADAVTAIGSMLIVQPATGAEAKNQEVAARYLTDYLGQVHRAFHVFTDAFNQINQSPSRQGTRAMLRGLIESRPKDAEPIRFALHVENGETARALPLLAENEFLQWKERLPEESVRSGPLASYADECFPIGDAADWKGTAVLLGWCKLNFKDPSALSTMGQLVQVAFEFGFDPFLGSFAGELLLTPDDQPEQNLIASICLVPGVTSAHCPWSNYLSAQDLKELNVRKKNTEDLLGAWGSAGDPVDRTSSRPSLQALRWSIQTQKNVIFPVNPLSDVVSDTPSSSIGNLVLSILEGRKKHSFSEWAASWEDPARTISPALSPNSTYTASLQGDVLCVRDEMEFLNQFAAIPETTAVQLDNSQLKGNVELSDLIQASSSPVWSSVKGRSICAGFQDFGDYVGAVPFLRLAGSDVSIKKRIISLQAGESFTLPVSQLKLEEEKRFLKDLKSCSSFIRPKDGQSSLRLFAWLPNAWNRLDALILSCRREDNGYTFSLKTDSGGIVWDAKLDLSASSVPS